MLADVIGGLMAFLQPEPLFYLILGIFLGLVVGLIPGLGGNFVLAVLLPLVFKMDPVPALALLLGAFSPTPTGGSITAILFGVPGTGQNSATIFDGFPLTQQGKGGRALGAALTASGLGGLFGAVVLMLMVPVLRPAVLAFGPPEFFMLVLLGIVFIGMLGNSSLLKGLVAGCLGLLLSLVGMDVVSGAERYTFGQLFLWDGVKLVPVVLGLFAVTEMIDLSLQGGSLSRAECSVVGRDVLEGVKDVFRHWFLFLRCSALGTLIGIIPGLGGDVATFIAYGHASQTSRQKHLFGKGAIEGVIAPESANNAKEGGALVPTLGFGIPGSSAMAILLGAFLILGITPGLGLLQKNPQLIFTMAWLTAASNVIAALIALVLARQLARLTTLRGSLLVPAVFVFAVLGSFAYRSSFLDVVVMLIFGLVGWVMKRLKYPRPSLLIGLVLGNMAEKNLQLALDLYGPTFFLRPISFVILVVILFTVGYPAWQKHRQGKEAAA